MNNEQWEHKIDTRTDFKISMTILLIMLAIFGGIGILLYINKNGAVLFLAAFSALFLMLIACSIYKRIFFKVYIGQNGFYYQSNPKNGKYYCYTDIEKAWESAGRATDGTKNYFCSIQTVDGAMIKFPFSLSQSDDVVALLNHIHP